MHYDRIYSHFLLNDTTLNLSANYTNINNQNNAYTQEVVDVLGFYLEGVGVDVAEEHVEEVVGDVWSREVHYSLLLLLEVVGEQRFEIERPGGQDHLMSMDDVPFDKERNITKVRLIQHVQEVPLLLFNYSGSIAA